MARKGELDPVFGRDEETKRAVRILVQDESQIHVWLVIQG